MRPGSPTAEENLGRGANVFGEAWVELVDFLPDLGFVVTLEGSQGGFLEVWRFLFGGHV